MGKEQRDAPSINKVVYEPLQTFTQFWRIPAFPRTINEANIHQVKKMRLVFGTKGSELNLN